MLQLHSYCPVNSQLMVAVGCNWFWQQSCVLPGTAALSLEDRLQGSLGGQACHEGNAVFRAAWVGKPARKPPPPTPKPAWLKRLPLREMWARVLTNPELRVQGCKHCSH